ncbi:LD-carboxypeptidase [Telmatospirillum siberiense]|uniref:LD-carboxypeptidase n=1 Tax=Telmatospirillum siberiense TaxID=382514 RepID=A0A2N3PVJ9_9PROT|nr:LD-carboxypeptidase [Telmatospirillum siberiense]PKU24421.1 LD-carboxypeptidase [Telmatospirillum siberiense]
MREDIVRIGVVAPASRIDHATTRKVLNLVRRIYPGHSPEIVFHPQCTLSCGHFAGDDEARARAFLEVANDKTFDALWFGRGGYGSCRLGERILPALGEAAREKIYLGYSDAGSLLGGLYRRGCRRVAHGPMPADIRRPGGEAAVARALAFLVNGAADALEPTVLEQAPVAAFNITILSHLIGTPLEPDLSGHILMLEEVSEHMYRIDRALFHLTSTPSIRRVAGIKLGRCSDIPPNEPDFGQTEEEVVRHWCAVSGIPYLGRADIGHDIDNKVVPFGRWRK